MRVACIVCGSILILLLIPFLLILPYCHWCSIVDYENPDFPSSINLNEMPQEIRKRYSIDGVFLRPSIEQKRLETGDLGYAVWVGAYCQEPVEIEIKGFSFAVNGKPVVLESPFSDRLMDDFKYWDDKRAFYAYLSSPPFAVESPDETKTLDVVLTVEVKRPDKPAEAGSIKATFKPRKRTYFFPQA